MVWPIWWAMCGSVFAKTKLISGELHWLHVITWRSKTPGAVVCFLDIWIHLVSWFVMNMFPLPLVFPVPLGFQTFWALLRWQYTDSFRDEHTRSVLLRGSSRYQPRVSEKFPSNPQSLNWLPGEIWGKVGWKLVESSEGREFRILRHRTASDGLGFPGSAKSLEQP